MDLKPIGDISKKFELDRALREQTAKNAKITTYVTGVLGALAIVLGVSLSATGYHLSGALFATGGLAMIPFAIHSAKKSTDYKEALDVIPYLEEVNPEGLDKDGIAQLKTLIALVKNQKKYITLWARFPSEVLENKDLRDLVDDPKIVFYARVGEKKYDEVEESKERLPAKQKKVYIEELIVDRRFDLLALNGPFDADQKRRIYESLTIDDVKGKAASLLSKVIPKTIEIDPFLKLYGAMEQGENRDSVREAFGALVDETGNLSWKLMEQYESEDVFLELCSKLPKKVHKAFYAVKNSRTEEKRKELLSKILSKVDRNDQKTWEGLYLKDRGFVQATFAEQVSAA
ncbi:MAG: hypothetical protein S4CHLAM45_14800 [Chlamydiales bacterium]|nr:hypothetical protein [Chlamydiales bacterium]MCH9620099.1 hypothetical protein [Chlamydiales bacterium]MCH9623569.1 hypothetical protein [Chlamydiales bacterium]